MFIILIHTNSSSSGSSSGSKFDFFIPKITLFWIRTNQFHSKHFVKGGLSLINPLFVGLVIAVFMLMIGEGIGIYFGLKLFRPDIQNIMVLS